MNAIVASAPSPMWYLTRGAGLVALVLLTASVVLGIVDFSRWRSERWPRFVVDAIHRNVSLLALAIVVVHVLTTVADSFTPIGLKDAIIPFLSPYRPLWLGMGTLALDILLAVAITSMLRRRLGYRAWRGVHWAAYACWPLAVVHGLGTGTDTPVPLILALTALCVAAVVIAIAWRAAAGWPDYAGRRLVAAAAIAGGPVALIAWLAAGPLAGNWASRAGTPATLLAAVQPATGGAKAVATPGLRFPFTAQLSGSIRQSPVSGSGLVSLDFPMKMTGGASGSLDVRMVGQALGGGGVAMTQSSVAMGPSAQPSLYTGRILNLQGSRMVASVSSSSGGTAQLQIDLSIDPSGRAVTGTLQAQSGGGSGA